jgi:TldD protein
MNGIVRRVVAFLVVCSFGAYVPVMAGSDVVLDAMQLELDRAMNELEDAGDAPMYYLQYSVCERRDYSLSASNGAFESPNSSYRRYLDVDVRVGSPQLDNTHEIRGGDWRDNYTPRRVIDYPLEGNLDALRASLWAETEYQFQKAQERYTKVLTNQQVKVEEADKSDDFSLTEPQRFEEEIEITEIDTAYWRSIMSSVADYFTSFPFVYDSGIWLAVTDQLTYMVSSEGHRLKHGNHYLRLGLGVSGMAEDGMELDRHHIFSSATMGRLAAEDEVMEAAERLVRELEELIDAPLVEPYIGPAVLRNRASGVFFHEIFGHRMEGHRQKSEREGQTFTKKVGEQILPEFISVYDDPSMSIFQGTELRGYYKFDDEGALARRVNLVENGVLRNFLMSRSPIENFPTTNGHGRRQYGYDVVSRQGNLIIESSNAVPYERLREMLIEECQDQDKPYGLIFDDISGGFTMTGRRGPQAFKVLPLLVYRVYADGRPDEVVRGVDIVGTPLTSFSKIIVTADDDGVFNGTCGAESGMIPVSAVSPSILVSEIEVEKRQKEQEKPPILPPPGHDQESGFGM